VSVKDESRKKKLSYTDLYQSAKPSYRRPLFRVSPSTDLRRVAIRHRFQLGDGDMVMVLEVESELKGIDGIVIISFRA